MVVAPLRAAVQLAVASAVLVPVVGSLALTEASQAGRRIREEITARRGEVEAAPARRRLVDVPA